MKELEGFESTHLLLIQPLPQARDSREESDISIEALKATQNEYHDRCEGAFGHRKIENYSGVTLDQGPDAREASKMMHQPSTRCGRWDIPIRT